MNTAPLNSLTVNMATEATAATGSINMSLLEATQALVVPKDRVLGIKVAYIVTAQQTSIFDPEVEVSVSNWQATLQSDRSCYCQMTLPAVSESTEVVSYNIWNVYQRIYRSADEYTDALLFTFEKDNISSYRGPTRQTVVLSGSFDLFALDTEAYPVGFLNTPVDLSGINTITITSGKYRVRCDIDYRLRPTRKAKIVSTDTGVSEAIFVADYINYYVSEDGAFMEVGSR